MTLSLNCTKKKFREFKKAGSAFSIGRVFELTINKSYICLSFILKYYVLTRSYFDTCAVGDRNNVCLRGGGGGVGSELERAVIFQISIL